MKTLKDALIRSGMDKDVGITFINGKDNSKIESYSELLNNAKKILGYLRTHNINKGDKLVFQIQDNYNFINVFWACILGGIIAVPIVVDVKKEFINKFFQVRNKLGYCYVICSDKRKDQLVEFGIEKNYIQNQSEVFFIDEAAALDYDEEAIDDVEIFPDDIAFIQFSSGSTGNPKGVILTHKNLVTNVEAIIKGVKMTREDRTVYWLPLTHDMGIIGCHISLVFITGNQYIMPTKLFISNPILWLKKITEYKSTMLAVSDFSLHFILSAIKNKEVDIDLSSVRFILNGAEPISVKGCKAFFNVMKNYNLNEDTLFCAYGMAEATLAISLPDLGEGLQYVSIDRKSLKIGQKVTFISESSPFAALYAKEGKAVDNVEIRICDENDVIVDDSVFGHIQIKGQSVSNGYFNEEDCVNSKTEDGWFRTGDIGFFSDGKLVVVGRNKEVVIINGYNYFSDDLERIANGIPEIRRGKIVVTDVYDKENGKDRIAAFIVYKNELDKFCELANALNALYRKEIGINLDYVIPIDAISKTSSGKVIRYNLRNNFENGEYDDLIMKMNNGDNTDIDQTLSKENIIKQLIKICQTVMNDHNLCIDTNLHEAGINSLLINEIYVCINEKYEDALELEDLFVCKTIEDIANKIYENIIENEDN